MTLWRGDGTLLQLPKLCPDDDIYRFDDLFWPRDRPLPYPTWGDVTSEMKIAHLSQLESMITDLSTSVQRQLEDHCYNTVGNFIT